jgi:hypothetical protein
MFIVSVESSSSDCFSFGTGAFPGQNLPEEYTNSYCADNPYDGNFYRIGDVRVRGGSGRHSLL